MFSVSSSRPDFDRMMRMIRDGEESDEIIEEVCQIACRNGRIKELMTLAWNKGNSYMLARVCWEWIITTTENLQSRQPVGPLVDAIMGEENLDRDFINTAKWVIWLCYWSAIDSNCFILAACASQYQDKFIPAGSAYWLVWHIETNPDFYVGPRYKDLAKECLEKGYLVTREVPIKGRDETFKTYEAGDIIPPDIPAPHHPKVKIEGMCDYCGGNGKTKNKKECRWCRGTGRDNKVVECSTCGGTGNLRNKDEAADGGQLAGLTLGPIEWGHHDPCPDCDQTGFVLKSEVAKII